MMNSGCIEEKNSFFKRPNEGMNSHLKPLSIRAKFENHIVNKILIDGGAAVNLMPHFLLRKIGKYDTDLRRHNMVLSNYEGKAEHTMGVIQVDLPVILITILIVFIVITLKASYNLPVGWGYAIITPSKSCNMEE